MQLTQRKIVLVMNEKKKRKKEKNELCDKLFPIKFMIASFHINISKVDNFESNQVSHF